MHMVFCGLCHFLRSLPSVVSTSEKKVRKKHRFFTASPDTAPMSSDLTVLNSNSGAAQLQQESDKQVLVGKKCEF